MSGMQATIRARAERTGTPEAELWQRREDDAFRRLAAARADLDRIEQDIAARRLPQPTFTNGGTR